MNDELQRVELDADLVAQVVGLATFAADAWTFGPEGPYQRPGRSKADITHAQLGEGITHLLELGVLTIDADRYRHLMSTGCPGSRSYWAEAEQRARLLGKSAGDLDG